LRPGRCDLLVRARHQARVTQLGGLSVI
jgi:hypothetical protein